MAYAGITKVVATLTDDELRRPSGCRGWTVADLLFHLTLDAQRALIAVHTPATAPPDVNAVTYWTPTGAAATDGHDNFVRRAAAAFSHPTGVVHQWTDTAVAAAHAADTADPTLRVATQGHVLAVTDFVQTLVTEAALHHLDLIVPLPNAPAPAPSTITAALSTLEGMTPLPAEWSPLEALRKATGRAPLTPEDRTTLGPRAAKFPLIS
jgi:hypothetical protein